MCVYVAITFITRLWLFNSSFRTFIHSFVHALLFIVTRYTIRSLPSGIYNSPDFFFQFYTDRFLLVSFLLRNFSSTIVHKLTNCYYCCYTTNFVRKSWKLFELPRLMHRDSRYRGPKQVSRCGTNLLRLSVRWTRSGRARESRIRKRAMLAGHSVDLTKHRARRRECRGYEWSGFPPTENYFVWWNERGRERLVSHRNSTVVGESSTRCELDDERGGFVGGLLWTWIRAIVIN